MEQEPYPPCRTRVGSWEAGALSDATYYLRFLRNGKRVWQRVGRGPDRALAALRNTEHDLHGVALGREIQDVPRSVGSPKPEPLPKSEASMTVPVSREMPLTEAIAGYMAEVRQFRSPKTIAACEHILKLFGSRYPKKTIQAITREICSATCASYRTVG